MYKIVKIIGENGLERSDGRYPSRKGCIIKLEYLQVSQPMILSYLKDNKGNDKSGCLRTSLVDGYSEYNDELKVYTMNSVYYFKRLN